MSRSSWADFESTEFQEVLAGVRCPGVLTHMQDLRYKLPEFKCAGSFSCSAEVKLVSDVYEARRNLATALNFFQ